MNFDFEQDVLGQFVLVRLPDPVTLGRDPDSETGLAGMQTLLLLVLGCAVQGPSKEGIIEDIKKLPLATQHDIVNCIQQVIIHQSLLHLLISFDSSLVILDLNLHLNPN